MLDLLWSTVGSWIVSLLPGFLLQFFITPKQVRKDFEVDLRSEAPVAISFGSTIPSVSVYLRCTNKSAVPVLVDRVVFEIWISQPVVQGAILRRVEVLPKQTREDLFFQAMLSGFQQETIRKHLLAGGRLDTHVHLIIDIYCECKVGRFEFRVTKNYHPAIVEGLPTQ